MSKLPYYVQKKIKENKYAIMMYGYDVWGSSASSNVEKMKELRQENKNLRRYYLAKPTWWQKFRVDKLGRQPINVRKRRG